MIKRPLSKDESSVYLKIVEHGSMDDMFDLGYAIGRASLAQEQIDAINAIKVTPLHNNN